MKLEPQVESLYRALDQELDNFPAGTKFYSVRKLMDKYKCHRGVLDGALDRLEENRLIDRVPQVGIFSSVTRRPNVRRILLAVLDWPSEVTLEWSRIAGAYVENREEWQLCKVMLPPGSETISSLSADGFDAAIIQTPSPNVSRGDMRFLASLTLPVVLLNADVGSFEISNVRSADADGAVMACHHLYLCGHREIAVMQSEPDTLPTKVRISSFARTAGLFGMKLVKIDCMTVSGEYAQHKAYLGMKQYLEDHGGEPGFTAVYAVTGEAVPGIMTALREFGHELPRDVSIIAHSIEQVGQFYHPPLTAVCADLAAEVEAAFSGIDSILKKQRASFKTEVPMKLIERNSVRTLTPKERI
ncbi:MAG: substrate-binding domain-containing protein [Lentisphaeria bacterium]|nr:substrate-binding domain-containing protein [Lentisphaeria bacterium]